jgi:hypothetical protein
LLLHIIAAQFVPRPDEKLYGRSATAGKPFWIAWTTAIADVGQIALGLVIGALTLAFPIRMLIAKSWPYFR